MVLVQALVVIAGLLALMTALAANQYTLIQATLDQMRQRRAEVAAQSAVARAVAGLQTADPNRVSLTDDWAVLGDNGNQAFELPNATFRLQIIDAGSLINVNVATEQQLQLLPLTPEQIAGLLDWRDGALQARPDGAKDEYYNTLLEPYNARLGRLTTISELLLIREWTAQTLYAVPTETNTNIAQLVDSNGNPIPLIGVFTVESGAPNTSADGGTRINFGQANLNAQAIQQFGVPPQVAQQIAQRAPYTSFQELLTQPGVTDDIIQRFLDNVTFVNTPRWEGKLNINTASQTALETLPGMTPDIAASMVSRQSTGLLNMGELITIPGMTGGVLNQVADYLTVGSDTWIVRAFGESGGVGVAIEATVGRRNERIQILTWERLATPDVPAWWGWQTEPTTTVTAGGGLP
jgi:general secretion pathway protein K